MLIREQGDEPRQELLKQGGIQLILSAMRTYSDDPRLLHTGCYALHQIGFSPIPKQIMLEHGGWDVFYQAVEEHLDEEPLVDLCLNALSKLSDDNDDDDEDIDNHNNHNNAQGRHQQQRRMVPLILRCMVRWPDSQFIQGHTLVLLLHAATTEPIPGFHAIQLVLKAMRRFEDTASLQFFGCAALREILNRTPGRHAVDTICRQGGIPCVLEAVQNHCGVFGLQPMALMVLMHIWEHNRHGGGGGGGGDSNNNGTRQQQEEQDQRRAAILAFGGSEHVVALVTGFQLEGADGANNEENNHGGGGGGFVFVDNDIIA